MAEKEKRKKKKSKENRFTPYEDGLLPTKYLNRKRAKIGEKSSTEKKSIPANVIKAKKNRQKKQKTEKSNDLLKPAAHDHLNQLAGIRKFSLYSQGDPFCT